MRKRTQERPSACPALAPRERGGAGTAGRPGKAGASETCRRVREAGDAHGPRSSWGLGTSCLRCSARRPRARWERHREAGLSPPRKHSGWGRPGPERPLGRAREAGRGPLAPPFGGLTTASGRSSPHPKPQPGTRRPCRPRVPSHSPGGHGVKTASLFDVQDKLPLLRAQEGHLATSTTGRPRLAPGWACKSTHSSDLLML